ncbi:MAG: PQQ-dependent sugar dehydrogenase [Pseudomonadota bacterium]
MRASIASVVTVLGLGLVLPALAGDLPKVDLVPVLEGLDAPIFLTSPADGTGRRFVDDQTGRIMMLGLDDMPAPEAFLDLTDRMTPLLQAFDERGLWSLAFHPGFARNGRLFVTYSARRRDSSPWSGETAYTWRLSEFRVPASTPNRADPDSERVILELDWINRKHNGGGLAFGPDGFLYVGVGDGGGVHGLPDVYVAPVLTDDDFRHAAEIKEDPYRLPPEFYHYDGWAQDLARLHGKILRLDVDGAEPYAIPPTNPFAGRPEGLDEIFAWGFRNPFRLAFDRAGAGDLFVNGVAESLWETIYMVDRPGNYGWAVREGTHCFDRTRAFDPPPVCPDRDATGEIIRDPVVEYPNWSVKRAWSKVEAEPLGTANVGGFVYRGRIFPELTGKLVFGDFSTRLEVPSGQVFVASPPGQWRGLWPFERLIEIDQRIHSLGEDLDGELYVLTTAQGIPVGKSGKVWKVVRP